MTIVRAISRLLLAIIVPLIAVVLLANTVNGVAIDIERLAPGLAFLAGIAAAGLVCSMTFDQHPSIRTRISRWILLCIALVGICASLWVEMGGLPQQSDPVAGPGTPRLEGSIRA